MGSVVYSPNYYDKSSCSHWSVGENLQAGRPNFRWTRRMMSTGLCGGSYYRTPRPLWVLSARDGSTFTL